MAIVYNGTRNLLPDYQVPDTYVRPTVAAITNVQYERTMQLNVQKETVENASAAVTMANIFNNSTEGLNKQIADILAADFLSTANVTAYGELIALGNTLQQMVGQSAALSSDPVLYTCTIKLYVKAL